MKTERAQLKLPPIPQKKSQQKQNSCSQPKLHSQRQSPVFDETSHSLKPCRHLPRDCYKNFRGSNIYKNYIRPCSCLEDFEPHWNNLQDRFVSLEVEKILSEEKNRRDFESQKGQF